ncbi:BppU family phage baseplate upper protein [Staphylococcus epidermidis]|nr:BppU family phage baseplate upper protein [Staphylococcus epidermidis]
MSVEELQKVATLSLEESAYLRPISGKGIGFYNLDKNTAQFQFRVTKDDFPLQISDKNIKGYAFFEENVKVKDVKPSTSGVIDLDFIDPLKGLVGVTVPPWFLKSVSNSSVLGEIYLSLNDVKNNGNDDTVVLGTFEFEVRDSLVNHISSDIKVSYIRMFDDLRTELELKVQQVKEEVGDLTSMVGMIQQTIEDALAKVNKAQSDAINEIEENKNNAKTELTSERAEALREIDAKRDSVKTDYDLASDSFQKLYDSNLQSFNTNANDANTTIDGKVSSFKELLDNDGFTTPAYVEQKFTDANWQKYKLTNDDGTNFYDANLQIDFNNNEQLMSLPIGTRYVVLALNNPSGTNNNGWLTKYKRNGDATLIRYQPYNSTIIYQKRFYKSWSGWERVGSDVVDTGWIDLQLINGAIPGTESTIAGGFSNAYRIIKQNGITKKMLRINATNIQHGQTIALLPKDFNLITMMQPVAVPRNRYGGRVTITASGTVTFNVLYDSTNWTPTDYAYAQIEWTE